MLTWQKLSDEEYHSRPEISFHGLMNCLRSYQHYQADRQTKKETQAMRFGTLAHLMALEPLEFKKRVKVSPKFDKRTKEGKAGYEAFIATLLPSDLVVDEDDYTRLMGMRAKLDEAMLDPNLSWIFKDIERIEEALFFQMQVNDTLIDCRMKPDAVGTTFILDYKTTQDASAEGFWKTVKSYNYDLQLYFYQYAESLVSKTQKELIILAQETEAPYEFQFHIINQDGKEHAWNVLDLALNKYVLGKTGKQTGYPRAVCELMVRRSYE
jgi:exodeoxyribonuclease VIII